MSNRKLGERYRPAGVRRFRFFQDLSYLIDVFAEVKEKRRNQKGGFPRTTWVVAVSLTGIAIIKDRRFFKRLLPGIGSWIQVSSA
jgi:hypothetical protein